MLIWPCRGCLAIHSPAPKRSRPCRRPGRSRSSRRLERPRRCPIHHLPEEAHRQESVKEAVLSVRRRLWSMHGGGAGRRHRRGFRRIEADLSIRFGSIEAPRFRTAVRLSAAAMTLGSRWAMASWRIFHMRKNRNEPPSIRGSSRWVSSSRRTASDDRQGKLNESTKNATAMKNAVPAAVTAITLPQLVGDRSSFILFHSVSRPCHDVPTQTDKTFLQFEIR